MMRRWIPLALLLAVLPMLARAQAPTGLEIMKERQNRHDIESETSRSEMTLFDRKGRTKVRELAAYHKKDAQGLGKTLLKFLSPPDIRNVGLLTWEQGSDREDDQWLYLPASRRVKRITGGSKKNPFMGTDLAYEDLRAEKLDAHSYSVVREEPIDGIDCWVIEAVPATEKERRDSGYGKRLLWVRKDIYFIVRSAYYNRKGKHVKTAVFGDLVKLEGELWRSNTATFERHLTKTKTVTRNISRKVAVDLADTLFTQQALKRNPTGE
jgi:hypothetical protein